ncbi:MAG: transposase [Nitrospiraceae bacterium]|nr:transposase [Nitrospiraceae bacterium]
MCIGKELLAVNEWEKTDDGVYISGDRLMYFIDDRHIYHDDIDREISKYGNPETIIFASRHTSESGRKTLSVHPIGNPGEAKLGGKSREFVPSSPSLMLAALSLLRKKADGTDYDVCYEVTHHGPYLSTPAFFIETGSTEKEWNDRRACRIIAETIMEAEEKGDKVAVGVGGGHYAPRFTDIALKRGIAFGHMLPDYQMPNIDEDIVRKAIYATPGAKYAYFHGKKGIKYKTIFEDEDIECIIK